ncbi:PutA family dehydrogenase [Penicillium cf. griseofulvum]|nr:PutA family dehydrogenase [Penicillium cf. griseofulvum]
MAASLQAVREAALDGRMHNIITRRAQLEALQQTLLDKVDAIQDAICTDTGYVANEAAAEYLLTLNTLKEYHQSLDIDRASLDEYAITRGEDAVSRRDNLGIVYIVPTRYTVFYSVLVAVAGGLTAGNCIVIEFPNTLRALPALIKKLLESSLDRSTIAFVSTPATDEDLGTHHIRLHQEDRLPGKVVAVVDRTANINQVAEALVTACFSFGGRSPYTPDIVFVNEYIKEPFLMALVQTSVSFASNASVMQGDEGMLEKRPRREGGYGDLKALPDNPTGAQLLVHTARSLDHAIDMSNMVGNLRAAYVFADNMSAKYLTQFINARVSFVNHIPATILVGPSAPEQVAFDRSVRYPTTVFSIPRPTYISPTPLSQSVTDILRAKSAADLRSKLVLHTSELGLSTQRPLGGGVGFFEQGILTGLGLFSISMLVGVSALGYWAWSMVAKHGSRI